MFHKNSTGYKFNTNIKLADLIIITTKGWFDILKNLIKLFKKRKYIQSRKIKMDYSKFFVK